MENGQRCLFLEKKRDFSRTNRLDKLSVQREYRMDIVFCETRKKNRQCMHIIYIDIYVKEFLNFKNSIPNCNVFRELTPSKI